MNKKMEKRLFRLQNPRLRKHNVKHEPKFVRPASNVAAVLDELSIPSSSPVDSRPIFLKSKHEVARDALGAAVAPVIAAEMLAIAAVADGVDAIKHRLSAKERKRRLQKRRKYYAAESERRKLLRSQIEDAKVAPIHPCPTATEILEAYRRRRESEEWKLRFGTLMIDLEEHVGRVYEITGNKFSGSQGGVRIWLQKNCPELSKHYHTCLRFKRRAQDDPSL